MFLPIFALVIAVMALVFQIFVFLDMRKMRKETEKRVGMTYEQYKAIQKRQYK